MDERLDLYNILGSLKESEYDEFIFINVRKSPEHENKSEVIVSNSLGTKKLTEIIGSDNFLKEYEGSVAIVKFIVETFDKLVKKVHDAT